MPAIRSNRSSSVPQAQFGAKSKPGSAAHRKTGKRHPPGETLPFVGVKGECNARAGMPYSRTLPSS